MPKLFQLLSMIIIGLIYKNHAFHQNYHSSHMDGYFPAHPQIQMAQITLIEVQCQKNSLSVKIKFDAVFNGIIYSKYVIEVFHGIERYEMMFYGCLEEYDTPNEKTTFAMHLFTWDINVDLESPGYYSDPNCRYVGPAGRLNMYDFVIYMDRCGTTFVDEFAQGGQAYLENTIVIQNEPGIQEVWDTARRIRCLWQGQFDKTVTSSINVDMLDVISVTYSGDTVDSYMDIQLGRGPFAPSVTGLVKIGDTLTMVIYVIGLDDFDMRVKDCIAHDGDVRNAIQLTDIRGCVLKKKLMGPWQKTKQTGSTGASVISYAFFQAFRFPDKMEVFLECNLEICKYQCQGICPDYPLEPRTGNSSTRYRRSESPSTEPIKLLRGFRVVTPEDIAGDSNGTVTLAAGIRQVGDDDICLSSASFVAALIVTLLVLLLSCLMTGILCVRLRNTSATDCLPTTLQTFSALELPKTSVKH